MNDQEREEWVQNDEGLYNWWQRTRLPLRRFIRENRAKLDEIIAKVKSGEKPRAFSGIRRLTVAKRIKDIEAKFGGMTLDGKEVLRLFARIEGKRPRRLPNCGDDEGMVPGNDVRAAWAAIALHVFGATTGQGTDTELEDVVCDLICDLGHFCDRATLEFPRLLRRAADHYRKETRGKGDQLRNIS